MPDGAGHFKGISVPELPWLKQTSTKRFAHEYFSGDLSRRVPKDLDTSKTGLSAIPPEDELERLAKEAQEPR